MYWCGLERTARDDPGLQRGVALDEGRVGEQRVAERDVAAELVAVGQDVAVDAERGAATDQRADQHRPAGRPRIGARLRPEPEFLQHRRHDRDVGRRRGDRQVHDALAGQPGNRRAADVLDVRSGRRSWMSSVTAAATSIVLGSHGSTVAGSRTYGPIGGFTGGV